MFRSLKCLVAMLACQAGLACASPEYFFVGAPTDPRCQFTSIQDALTAAAANGPDLDYVMVANTAGYTNQALFIGNQSVLIQGGYRSCDLDDDEDQPYAALSGNGSDPVIRVEPVATAAYTNYRVVLSRLRLSGGGRDDANGGGLRVVTAANVGMRVRIEGSEITGNRAYHGGGVYLLTSAAAQSGSSQLTIYPGTRIHANTAAQLGGGLHVSGGVVFMASDAVSIDHNTAAGAGGGIMLQPGTLFVDNPDYDVFPRRDDVSGAHVDFNSAGTYGGGIAVGLNSQLTGGELIVDGNTAALGGGGIVVSNNATASLARDPENVFGWTCPRARQCLRLSNNTVGNGSTPGLVGGAIAMTGNSDVDLAQALILGNRAQDGSAIHIDGNGRLHLEGVALHGNRSTDTATMSSAVIRARYASPDTGADLVIAYSTFAGNLQRRNDGSERAALDVWGQQGTALAVHSSAFFDSAYPWVMYNAHASDCTLRRGGGALDGNGTHTRAQYTDLAYDRIFISPTQGDWRPRFDSPLVDYCDAVEYAASHRDRDLQPRCRDDAAPNQSGTCDLGAWENEQIFADGVD